MLILLIITFRGSWSMGLAEKEKALWTEEPRDAWSGFSNEMIAKIDWRRRTTSRQVNRSRMIPQSATCRHINADARGNEVWSVRYIQESGSRN